MGVNGTSKGTAVFGIGRRTKRQPIWKKPNDIAEFKAEISRNVRDLNFSLGMLAVELRYQGFSEEQITKIQEESFQEALKAIGRE